MQFACLTGTVLGGDRFVVEPDQVGSIGGLMSDRAPRYRYRHSAPRPAGRYMTRRPSILETVSGRMNVWDIFAPGLLTRKGSPYSITERRVPELIPILGSQPAGDVSH